MKKPKWKSTATRAVHAGESPRRDGAVTFPVYQSAMYLYSGEKEYGDLRYIRLNNTPNADVLHAKLAALENGEDALVTASGMAAISSTLMTVLSGGGHLLAQGALYGGTYDFICNDFDGLGFSCDFVDIENPAGWEALLRPNTRAIYVETLSNPTLRVADLEAVVAFARKHNLVSIIDNTFATPINCRPAEWGIDVVLHSATKYLNGHSDIVAGAIVASQEWIAKIKHKLNHFGGSLDPHACFLLQRGLKTLHLRVERQNENALALARFLDAHPAVQRVNYPGLASHPQNNLAKRILSGFGGMMSFELNASGRGVETFLEKLTLPLLAPSLGGVESLVVRPAVSSHAGMSKKERKTQGISDAMVRVSVGVEDVDELIEDFKQALEGV